MQRLKITLECGNHIGSFYTYRDRYKVQEALEEARDVIGKWLDGDEIPVEYEECWCDEEFYIRSLELHIDDLEADGYDDEIVWNY